MGLTIDYTAVCDGCRLVQKTHIEWGAKSIDRCRSYMDVWGPGLPAGWLQATRKDEAPLLFHSRDCYKNWLRRTGQLEELERFENGVWIA